MIARASQNFFADQLETYTERVNQRLTQALRADPGTPEKLLAAMEYSVLGAGKRVRPLLAYAAGELCGLDTALVDPIAAAVELVHAYSLIHDDLPSMDDDDLRRGRPTTHRAFDEATAILAGDALQALAFEILCADENLTQNPRSQIKLITWLARAIGPSGMVGGQALDLAGEGQRLSEQALEDVHRRKTGQLIRASIMMPSEFTAMPAEQRQQLDAFARDIGLVFQIRDDLLEVEQDTATLGKDATSDSANQKSTYPQILGIEEARKRADFVYAKAIESLQSLGPGTAGLMWLSDFILKRTY